jgi:hypothetical protein
MYWARNLVIAVLLSMGATPVFAQTGCVPNPNLTGPPFVNGCPMAASSLNNISANSTSGLFMQTGSPPSTLTSWLNTNNVGGKNPYGYLGSFGQLVVPTNYGQMAIVGAAQTANTSGTCCGIGLAGVGINNNTIRPQTSWPFYSTGARLAATGAIQNESDVANVDSVPPPLVNPYLGPREGPPGTSGVWYFGAGGEPPQVGSSPNADISFMLFLANNGSYAAHGIVWANNLFNPSTCTVTCPAMDLSYGQEMRWSYDNTDAYGSFVRGNNQTAGAGNGLVFTQFGALFENAAGGFLGQVAQTASVTNTGYIILGSIGADAAISVGTGNGGSNQNIQVQAAGSGKVVVNSVANLPSVATGTPAASLCIDASNNIIKKTTAGSCI